MAFPELSLKSSNWQHKTKNYFGSSAQVFCFFALLPYLYMCVCVYYRGALFQSCKRWLIFIFSSKIQITQLSNFVNFLNFVILLAYFLSLLLSESPGRDQGILFDFTWSVS